MKIWTLTYNDDNGVRTEVFNSAEAADKAAHVWITEYWDDYMVEEHGLLPERWSWAYEKLCETSGFMDSIHVETHNITSDLAPKEIQDPIEKAYLAAAQARGRDGELEIDSNANVSVSEDAGAYVQGWVWVSDDEVDTSMAIIEPSGTVWYFELFDQFQLALAGTPGAFEVKLGTPELLEKSGGVNDAWEFLTAGNDDLKFEDLSIGELQEARLNGNV
ncbi:hypothetical protein N9Y00_06970 [Tateyamaria sp.]|nr:hypothetical protein [Tateyamaria sp.]